MGCEHLVWAKTELPVEEYLAFFQTPPGPVGSVRFEERSLDMLIEKWRTRGLISPPDEEDLRHAFGETRRGYINVIPGFQITRDWPMSKVINLEASERLGSQLANALREPLRTWQETIPEWRPAQ